MSAAGSESLDAERPSPFRLSRRGRGQRADRGVVPAATVARLPLYLRALCALADEGIGTVSSETLAGAAGVTSAKVRKDLSQLGTYGTRGVGYDVACLSDEISRELGLTQHRSVVLIGVGNLGHALAGYGGFSARGFRIAALLDADPQRAGEAVGGVVIQPVDDLEAVVRETGASIGVIATPAGAAQTVCNRLVACGIRSILNFAPAVLSVPDGVEVRKVDLAVELQILSFHEARRSRDGQRSPGPDERTVVAPREGGAALGVEASHRSPAVVA